MKIQITVANETQLVWIFPLFIYDTWHVSQHNGNVLDFATVDMAYIIDRCI